MWLHFHLRFPRKFLFFRRVWGAPDSRVVQLLVVLYIHYWMQYDDVLSMPFCSYVCFICLILITCAKSCMPFHTSGALCQIVIHCHDPLWCNETRRRQDSAKPGSQNCLGCVMCSRAVRFWLPAVLRTVPSELLMSLHTLNLVIDTR